LDRWTVTGHRSPILFGDETLRSLGRLEALDIYE